MHTNSFDLQFDERDPERCKDLQLKPLLNITVLEVVWVFETVLITVVSDLDEFELDDIEESVGETESSPDRPLAIVTQGMHQVKPKIMSFQNLEKENSCMPTLKFGHTLYKKRKEYPNKYRRIKKNRYIEISTTK